jgi:uncharacterized membrane protein
MIKALLAIAFVFLIFDYIFLMHINRQMWYDQIKLVQGGAEPKFRVDVVALCVYAIMVFASYTFVVKQKYTPKETLGYGSLLGLAMYGVFDGTNYVIFKDYTLQTGIIDTVYGMAVTAVACYAGSLFMSP